jgi:hypothetical protein
MDWRLYAVVTALIVVGSALVGAPVSQGRVYTTLLDSGQWLDVPIPATASWTGSAVDVLLSWGTVYPPGCTGLCGPSRYGYPPQVTNLTYLLIFDCGKQRCTLTGNYTFVGATEVDTGGNTGFVATPGHYYQVWLMASTNSTQVTSIPVRYALQGPILGGVFGAVGVAWGGLAAVEAAGRWWGRRKGGRAEKAFL